MREFQAFCIIALICFVISQQFDLARIDSDLKKIHEEFMNTRSNIMETKMGLKAFTDYYFISKEK